ncbi:hypothetical protein DPMN_023434 [Dreissena polymorpha]|uniref:Uncharacterized protein n=1 Tax=Dreissena polymorpha TaxID=45954 RepID=A0A9D4RAQ3_DREPO|nr:hypothetical protein DPMN_023434 [Dreissena polymorpha]
MTLSVTKEFVYVFTSKDQESTLRVPVPIPHKQSAEDLTGRLIYEHNLPCYVEKDLSSKLEEFVCQETNKLSDENAQEALDRVRSGDVDVEALAAQWERAYTQEVKDFAAPEVVSKEQQFSEVYHSLIHSPALETLLNLEHTYALTIEDLINQRDKDLEHLDQIQREDMEKAVKSLGVSYTDEQINQLAQQHFESTQMIEGKWANELSNQHEIQRREFRDWVMKVHEDSRSGNGTPSYMHRVRAMTSNLPDAEEEERTAVTRMEESFTIILGAQLKTTHNLRLLCASPLDLCRHKPHTVGGVMLAQPQRLQTAMSLYSNNLNGLILLVDSRLNAYTGIKKEFSKVCERSTDFHFPNLNQQFAQIQEQLQKAGPLRKGQGSGEEADRASVKSGASYGDTQVGN